jgi:hypothetical protein
MPDKRNPAAMAASGASEKVRSDRTTESVANIVVLVEALDHHGRFRAYLDGQVIVASSRQPFVDGARRLIDLGHDPKSRLEMWHAGAADFSLRAPLGVAAKLMVEESAHGPIFRRHRIATASAVAPPLVVENDGANKTLPDRRSARLRSNHRKARQ